MNFSFAGCGFLGIYHVGVSSCLKQHAPHLVQNCQFAGASAGAIVACCLLCDCCLGDCTTFTLRLATKARSFSLGPLHPSFKITKILRDAMRQVLPDNAHELATGRLHISLTRVSDRKCVVVSEYDSKEELIQALLCSAHVPLYSGLVPPTFRGVRYVDGGLSDNIPVLNDQTVSISPFAGESDICPSDGSLNPLHIYLANTSMQCTMGNLYRMSRALFPPHPEILSDMCQQGFDDCLKYLQNNKLLSCVRHLSIRSVVTPVVVTPERDEVDNQDVECEEQHCSECKKKMQVALVDKLPHVVGSALQEACDNVNKGVKAYIYRHRTLRFMSFLATPWFLPVDIGYTYAVRFLEYLPHLPQDVQLMYRETADILRYLVTNIHHQRRRYTARFSCHLAITEVNYGEIDGDIFPSHNDQGHQQVAKSPQNFRNLNFDFAVDLDSDLSCSDSAIRESVHDHLDAFNLRYEARPRSDSCNARFCSHHAVTAAAKAKKRHPRRRTTISNEVFDTFEQCLHVSNQMESVMAYHYQDENNKDQYLFEEIYSLSDSNIDLSSFQVNQTHHDQPSFPTNKTQSQESSLHKRMKNFEHNSVKFARQRSMSLQDVDLKDSPHLECNLEEFIGQRSDVVIQEHRLMESTSS